MMKSVIAIVGVVGTLVWLFLAERASDAPDGTAGEVMFDLSWAIIIGGLTITCLQ